MNQYRTYASIALSLLTLGVSPAAWSADCATLQGSTQADGTTMKTADVATCAHSGWDPPAALVTDPGLGQAGANASGSGGFSVGTVQAPQSPPLAAGAPSSVSQNVLNFNLSFSAIFGGSSGSGSSSSGSAASSTAASTCPVRDDTTGAYGPLTAIPPTPFTPIAHLRRHGAAHQLPHHAGAQYERAGGDGI